LPSRCKVGHFGARCFYVNRQYLVQFLISDLKQNKRNNKKKRRQISSYTKPGAEPDIFIWGGALEEPVLQQGELSIVCVGLSERDLKTFGRARQNFGAAVAPHGTPLAPPLFPLIPPFQKNNFLFLLQPSRD